MSARVKLLLDGPEHDQNQADGRELSKHSGDYTEPTGARGSKARSVKLASEGRDKGGINCRKTSGKK
jgi:hypothetical protein